MIVYKPTIKAIEWYENLIADVMKECKCSKEEAIHLIMKTSMDQLQKELAAKRLRRRRKKLNG